MKAAVLYGKEDVRIEDVPASELKEGEVRVAIEAALTCGTDLKVFRRGYHARMIVPPATFGHEFAGVIVETSVASHGWHVGDRVVVANSAPCGTCYFCGLGQENLCNDLLFLNGAYAESIVVPARLVQKNMLHLKPGTSFSDAALVEPLACVVQGIQDTNLKPNERVLVLGAGPIGLMFVRLAAAIGCEVWVAGKRQVRLQAARKLGAHEVVDVSQHENLHTHLITERHCCFDAVIEAVGRPEAWEAAIALVRKGGRVNLFGGCPAGTSVSLDTTRMHYMNLTLLASFHHTPRTIRRALEHVENGTVNASDFVTGSHTLEELPDLLRSMAEGNSFVKTRIVTRKKHETGTTHDQTHTHAPS